jgi:hypothetical protein
MKGGLEHTLQGNIYGEHPFNWFYWGSLHTVQMTHAVRREKEKHGNILLF